MSNQKPSIEEEIFTVLNNIVHKGGMIQADERYSLQEKDIVKRIVDEALNSMTEQLSETKITQLVNLEVMKKMKKKMLEDLEK